MEIRQAASLHSNSKGQARRSLGRRGDAIGGARPAARFRRRVLLQGIRRAASPAPGPGAGQRLRAAGRRDKSDAEFESLLLEILSDYQISIPELGTVAAVVKPTVILTSNGERDLSDALKRRCLHLHIGFPEQKLEERIVESRVPGISQRLRGQIVGFINQVRALDLKKLPSVSETIDWARVLVLLQSSELDHGTVKDTLNVLLKYEADIETTMPQVTSFVAKAGRQGVFG